MSETPRTSHATRRTVLQAAAWATPTIALAAAAPAMAATPENQRFGIVFDGGGGADGYFNSMYMNLFSSTGQPITLTQPVTLTMDVVGLTGSGAAERSQTAGASTQADGTRGGAVPRSAYNQATRTTRYTWTLPVGTVVPAAPPGSKVAIANPDVLFTFRDGADSGGRITNKVVVRSIAGGRITDPSGLPLDSSVVKDFDKGAVSPNGIY